MVKSILLLTLYTFCGLRSATIYFTLLPSYAWIEQKIGGQETKKAFILPGVLTLVNVLLPEIGGFSDRVYIVLFFWLVFIFFFLPFLKKYTAPRALIYATVTSEVLILITYFLQSEVFNNLLVLFAYIAAVSLFLKRITIQKWIWILIFAVVGLLDVHFVLLTPTVHTLDIVTQPFNLTFSPLLQSGDLSIGTGDITFLLLAMLLLSEGFSTIKTWYITVVLSAIVPIVFIILSQQLPSYGLFPFLAILSPVFLLLYILKLYLYREHQRNAL